MSQEKLGEALGLTFQQIQKYERGANRISAGTLYRLAQILDVPVSFFFDGLDETADGRAPQGDASDAVLTRREARILRLSRRAPVDVVEQVVGLLSAVCRDGQEVDDLGDEASTDTTAAAAAAMKRAQQERRRRRYGAVWDPSDIGAAARDHR